MYLPSNLTTSRPSALHMAKLFNSANACHLKKASQICQNNYVTVFFKTKEERHSSFIESKVGVNVCTRSGRVVKRPIRLVL